MQHSRDNMSNRQIELNEAAFMWNYKAKPYKGMTKSLNKEKFVLYSIPVDVIVHGSFSLKFMLWQTE